MSCKIDLYAKMSPYGDSWDLSRNLLTFIPSKLRIGSNLKHVGDKKQNKKHPYCMKLTGDF